jgi:hypothetical protein
MEATSSQVVGILMDLANHEEAEGKDAEDMFTGWLYDPDRNG